MNMMPATFSKRAGAESCLTPISWDIYHSLPVKCFQQVFLVLSTTFPVFCCFCPNFFERTRRTSIAFCCYFRQIVEKGISVAHVHSYLVLTLQIWQFIHSKSSLLDVRVTWLKLPAQTNRIWLENFISKKTSVLWRGIKEKGKSHAWQISHSADSLCDQTLSPSWD